MGLKLVGNKIIDTDRPRAHVRFYEHAKKVGIGKYIPVDFVEIKPVGQRDFMPRLATEQDKIDYPREWAEYQSGLERENAETTPLNVLPAFKSYFGLELGQRGIHTVEELSVCEECPLEGAERLWSQAKAYIRVLEEEDGEQVSPQSEA